MVGGKTKNLFAQTILGKILGTKQRNLVKLDRRRKFDIYFGCF